jgi:excisionase family DNA binding protein
MADIKCEPDKVLTVKEAAARLGYGLSTTYGLFDAGELRGFRKGRKGIRIFPSSITEYIERNMNTAPSPSPVTTTSPESLPEPAVVPMLKVKRRAAHRKTRTFEDVVVLRSA